MNLVLFEQVELGRPLPCRDARAVHLLRILHRRAGETFDAGVIGGPRGTGTLVAVGPEALTLAFAWQTAPPPAEPFTLIVGLPRPQTARDILRDATTLGVAAIHFVGTDKGEPGYARSTLWSSGEWRRHVLAGASQACSTRIPEVTFRQSLAGVIASLGAGDRLALDNYEAPLPLGGCEVSPAGHTVLAVGSERGWSAAERDTLRAHGFRFHHLGSRVLRTEAACLAALAILRAKRGLM
ncbi:MAG: RNA methyltransferase [Verrucomicrobia bacterium]|nr:RNA methyltransferase [Verrucomicrobiota bacterium]